MFFFFLIEHTKYVWATKRQALADQHYAIKKKKADRHYSPSQPQLNKYVQNLLKNIRYGLSIFGQSSWKH